jgi:hypothetical protein
MLTIIFDIYQRQTDNLKSASTNEAVVYDPAKFNSLDEFCNGAMAELTKMNQIRKAAGHQEIVFSSLNQYIRDRALLKTDIGKRYDIAKPDSGVNQTITWGQIEPIANDAAIMPNGANARKPQKHENTGEINWKCNAVIFATENFNGEIN